MAQIPFRTRRRRSFDGRTWQARLVRRVRADLLADLGEGASAIELALVDRAAALSVALAELDRRAAADADGPDDQLAHAGLAQALVDALGRLAKPARPAAP